MAGREKSLTDRFAWLRMLADSDGCECCWSISRRPDKDICFLGLFLDGRTGVRIIFVILILVIIVIIVTNITSTTITTIITIIGRTGASIVMEFLV